MGNKTNVRLKVSKTPADSTPLGVTVTYQVGAIPVAVVSLIPKAGNDGVKISSGFGDIEPLKRKDEIDIDIEVESYFSPKDKWVKKTLKFTGLLDGMSLHNAVGHNTYQAVYKGRAQVLLELTTLTPGLYPTSVNIYRNPDFRLLKKTSKNSQAVTAWGRFTKGLDFLKSPIEFYTEVLKLILKNQENGNWKEFVGVEKLTSNQIPFKKIFEDERYKKALKMGLELFKNINIDAVNGGDAKSVTSSHPLVNSSLLDLFSSAPTSILENYLHFLSYMGCSMIFANSKSFVVPGNSVLKRDSEKPEPQQSGGINEAFPSDFSNFSFNDNGFKDLAHVIVIPDNAIAGAYLGNPTFDTGNLAHYTDPLEHISQATGVLVTRSHPFMQLGAFARSVTDTKITPKADAGGTLHEESKKLTDAADESQNGEKEAQDKKKQEYKETVGTSEKEAHLENYAQTRLYQEKYVDRTGSVTMEFNPDWVPGTGGVLYVRHGSTKEGDGVFISFNVISVTHHISTGAPSNGQAITTINFNCGRVGDTPLGIKEYAYFGYDLDKEKAVQKAFIADLH